jgi:hypothetical protein
MSFDLATIENDLLTYADYDTTESVARAKLYVVAARRWLTLIAGTAANQSSSMSRNVPQVQMQLDRAQAYVDQNATSQAGARVRFYDFDNGFR